MRLSTRLMGSCPMQFTLNRPLEEMVANCGKKAVSLPFVEVGGLQDCKCPTQLIFKGVNRFRRDDARNLCDGVLLGDKHVIHSIF